MSNKIYCGLDFHKNVSELCLMNGDGEIVDRIRTSSEHLVKVLANKGPYHIGVETSGGVFDIASKLERLSHKVTLINSVQFRGIGLTGKKNDRNDAEALATALRLGFIPEVYKKTLYARRIKSLLTSRDMIVRLRVNLTNHIRGIMREYGLPLPHGATAFWGQVQERLGQIDCSIVRASLRELCGQAGNLKDQELRIEGHLKDLCQGDERVERLQSIPSVGPLTALAFVAVIEDAKRFKNAQHLAFTLVLLRGTVLPEIKEIWFYYKMWVGDATSLPYSRGKELFTLPSKT